MGGKPRFLFVFIIIIITIIYVLAIIGEGYDDKTVPIDVRNSGGVRVDPGIKTSTRRVLSVCSSRDISISQGHDRTPGMPHYDVEILNSSVKISGCPASQIHVYCGWFASASLVDPNVFRRLAYNDCLVNAGKALKAGELLRFRYANSFMYPLRLRSVKFC